MIIAIVGGLLLAVGGVVFGLIFVDDLSDKVTKSHTPKAWKRPK